MKREIEDLGTIAGVALAIACGLLFGLLITRAFMANFVESMLL